MSKINFIALGGVQEIGKNLYILEVDGKCFIVDCGLKYPSSDLRGIDFIINDTTYIEQNIKNFYGIFLTNASNTSIGGVSFLLKNYRLRVYASKFTVNIVKAMLIEDGISDVDELVFELDVKSPLIFGNVTIRAFEVSNNIPGSYGYSFKTPDGYLIFALEYNFDQNANINYSYMYRELAVFAKDGVLALITSSIGALTEASRGSILELSLRLRNIIAGASGRIIIPIYSKDIIRLKLACNIALEYNKKIAIIGRKNQKIVNTACEMEYVNIPNESFVNLKYITDSNDNDDKNLVIIVPGERDEIFRMLERMSRGFDRLINIKESDTLILLNKAEIGTERKEAKTLDLLYKRTSNIKTFSESLLPDGAATREEIKQMVNILKPKYIIPVLGEYRHQYSLKDATSVLNIKEDDIIIPDNGDVLSFYNGKYQGIKSEVPVGEILIDGKAIDDVSDIVLKDREILSQDGLIIITASINPRIKKILAGPEVVTRGFIFIKDNEQVINHIKELFNIVADKYLKAKFINWNDFKTDVKAEVSKYIYKDMKRNPIIIPVLLSTEM